MSSPPSPPPALMVRCPTCDAEPGQNCRQPLGRAHILCPLCGAPPGQDCRQQQACHRSREFDVQQAASRKAKRSSANGGVPRSALTGATTPKTVSKPSWALEPNGPPSTMPPPWMIGPPPGRVYDVTLREDATSKIKYTITRRALDAIKEHTQAAGGTETGGVLCGIRGYGDMLITDAAPPGPRTKATSRSLKPDGEHDVRFVAALERAVGGQVVELGFWHSHPYVGSGRPSRADLQHGAGMQEMVGIANYLELIATPDADGWQHPTLHGWVVREGNPGAERWRWWICEPAAIETARW